MKKYRFYLSAFVDIVAENREEAEEKFFDAHGNKTLDIQQTDCYDYVEEDPDNEGEV